MSGYIIGAEVFAKHPSSPELPSSERRISLATKEEVERFAPDDESDGTEFRPRLDADPAPAASRVTVDEYVVPPRAPRSEVFLLQDWITLSGRQGALIAQDESSYLDFSDFQDVMLFVEVSAFPADQAIAIETSPAKLDGWFRSMTTINVVAVGVEQRIVRWSTASIPPARWIRWKTGNLFSDWTVTFRVFARGLRPLRPFLTQPETWITMGEPPPPRQLVRVVRPANIAPSPDTTEIPEGQQLIHYTDETGSDLPKDVRSRLVHAGTFRRSDLRTDDD